MIEFESFEFSGDKFYQVPTQMPLALPGLTLLRGKNLDAKGNASNGTGKTRLVQILEGFIYGRNPRGLFKKTVLPEFTGTLKFKDGKGDRWSFSYTPKEAVGAWTIHKNDIPIKVSHKPTDNLELLQKTVGITRDEWGYFVYITQRSLDILIKGKNTERRNYLENFFNIDTFYSQKFAEYNLKWKGLKDEIETLKNDRIRLDTVNEARKELPGEEWAKLQLGFVDDALSLLRDDISSCTTQQTELRGQIETWNNYHALFRQLQGLDAKLLKTEHDSLLKTQIELERKEKIRKQLDLFVKAKLTPHQSRIPKQTAQKPDTNKPNSQDITDKEVALNQMREKLRLKKQVASFAPELGDLNQQLDGVDPIELDATRKKLYKERVDAEEHYKLLQKGGDACPTCKQPLAFILDGMSVAERMVAIDAEVKRLVAQEKECLRLATLYNKSEKLNQQLDLLKEQFSRYPTFGVKLADAEAGLISLKELAAKWEAYEREQEALVKWQTTNDLLLTEAKGLGYPEILGEDHSEELKQIEERLPGLALELKLFDRFDALTDEVLKFDLLPSLEAKEQTIKEDLAELLSRIESLNEFKGVLRTQLTNIGTLKSQAEVLEAKVIKQAAKESEAKILELLNTFYSPTGFKIFELKKRCQKMIERANYWSKLFFAEPHTWSLSEDLDDLDFLIQPTHYPDTEPFPISLLSAGEFNRAARVLLFSQLELIPPNKKTNLLVLDEIEANLDEAGMLAFTEVVLPTLRETFPDRTIIVISHQSSLHNAGVLDHIFLAERKDRKTTLTVYPDYQRKRA